MKKGVRILLAAGVLALAASAAFAEQITRVGILDIEKVYSVYFRESRAVKEFQEQKARVLREIKRIDDEILRLEAEKLEAENSGDAARALKLDTTIFQRKQYRDDYKRVKNEQLRQMSEKLYQSDAFLDELLAAIKYVAESEGFTLVLNNSRQYQGFFFYYTPEIDITEKVIQELMRRSTQGAATGG